MSCIISCYYLERGTYEFSKVGKIILFSKKKNNFLKKSNDVYAGAFAIFILSLIGLSCYSGWKLIKSTKSIWENTRVKEFKIFFKKVHENFLIQKNILIF